MTKDSASSPTTAIVTLSQAAGSYIDSLLTSDTSYELGLPPIDRVMGGVRAGDMCVIAARTGMGKSAVALQAALHNAPHVPVCFVSLEMTPEQLAKRAIQRYTDLHSDNWPDHHAEVLRDAAPLLRTLGNSLFIVRPAGRDIRAVAAAMIECQERHGCKLFIVDYLQKIAGKGLDRYQQVTFVSEELKDFALKNKLPLIVLAQLSRQTEGRSDGRPRMSDLRDSGSIEQDADQVILLWAPHAYDRKASEHDLALVMPKSRHTRDITSELTMHFDKSRQTISERAAEWREPPVNRVKAFDHWNEGGSF